MLSIHLLTNFWHLAESKLNILLYKDFDETIKLFQYSLLDETVNFKAFQNKNRQFVQ